MWLGLSPFELSLQVISVLATTILIPLKMEKDVDITWWTVLSPIWIANAMWLYFRFIVYLRIYFHFSRSLRQGGLQSLVWTIAATSLLFAFEMLLCQHLEHMRHRLSTVLVPIFILISFLLVRSFYKITYSGSVSTPPSGPQNLVRGLGRPPSEPRGQPNF